MKCASLLILTIPAIPFSAWAKEPVPKYAFKAKAVKN